MALLTVRHVVQDYTRWRAVYDDAEPIRARHGCTARRVLRTPGDPNDLLVIHEFPTAAQAAAFADDPDLKAAMHRAGVAGSPRTEIYDETA
jgi:quinol monooxygenase YgiN